MRLAVFDAIVNNADRKGGHILTDGSGRVWGIDHGVTFSVEDKLRTVLWGWAGEVIPDDVLADVGRLHDTLGDGFDPVDRWLDDEEREALRHRVRTLPATSPGSRSRRGAGRPSRGRSSDGGSVVDPAVRRAWLG